MPRRPANGEVLAALAKVLHKRKIRWYVFGAQAAVVYGSPRMTMDVDVTVALPNEGVRPLVEALLGAGFASRADDREASSRDPGSCPSSISARGCRSIWWWRATAWRWCSSNAPGWSTSAG
jgi:hypothetical protein